MLKTAVYEFLEEQIAVTDIAEISLHMKSSKTITHESEEWVKDGKYIVHIPQKNVESLDLRIQKTKFNLLAY